MSETDHLVERWRKPVIPMAVESTDNWATAELGRATLDYKLRLHPDDVERVRLGYVCIRCMEPHPDSWPEACALCGFPIRDQQLDEFTRLYKGEQRNPRAELIERELDKLDDKHERNFHVNKLGIIVPGHIKE